MKFSYNWLKQLVDFKATAQELADDLSLKSVEVEGIELVGGEYLKTVVVGLVESCEKHPNADRLKVCQVNTGTETRQIVCGAPNVAAGQKVPVALPGTVLPKGEIKISKIRDVESQGMICGPDELELGPDTGGIMVLPEDAVVGQNLYEIFADTILDGAILANRGDLQNHRGLAREIAAIYSTEFSIYNFQFSKEKEQGSTADSVELEWRHDQGACSLYQACLIKNITVAPSPLWMQARLIACGIKPINNIVDITNYVMLEVGNPLHAFDFSKLTSVDGKTTISIRLSKEGEKITTLDGVKRELPAGVLVIADTAHPVAVAGILGGLDTAVTSATTEILLEAAHFSSPIIRHGQREIGVRTESSSRFEKGLSEQLAIQALERARALIAQIIPGATVGNVLMKGESEMNPVSILIESGRINQYLGTSLTEEEMSAILIHLGFVVVPSGSKLLVQAPVERQDIHIWQDIAEEVARIYGLDQIPEILPDTSVQSSIKTDLFAETATRDFLVRQGWTQVFTYSLLQEQVLEDFGITDYDYQLTNPLPDANSIPRSTLIPGLLLTAAENLKHRKTLALFDLSHVYAQPAVEDMPSSQSLRLGMLYANPGDNQGIFTLKHEIDQWAANFGLTLSYTMEQPQFPNKHPGRYAKLYCNTQWVGEIYELHPQIVNKFDLDQRIWVAQLFMDLLSPAMNNLPRSFVEHATDALFNPYSKYEVSRRDLAIVVSDDVVAEHVIAAIRSVSVLIVDCVLFDEFRSEKIGAGKKSLALRLTLQADDHTLSEQEIEQVMQGVQDQVVSQFTAQIRG